MPDESDEQLASSSALLTEPKQSDSDYAPKSSHTSDPFLRDFLNPKFDAASYLNAALPPLAHKPNEASRSEAVSLAELSAQAQTLLSQLSVQTTRLSNTLTQLTDDILKSGSRLAYEVELLQGETLSLAETLYEKLQDDVEKFVPGGLQPDKDNVHEQDSGEHDVDADDPEFIKQLQTLSLVRTRLDSVIKTFGEAMDFTFPPSELSVSSSFLSVSAPEPGSQQQSSEEKGQQTLKELRDEIAHLLGNSEDPVQGIEDAANRIQELKELASVWKGTAEEKGRNKFIESLAKMVEDRHRDLLREVEQTAKREGKAAAAAAAAAADGGGGAAASARRAAAGGAKESMAESSRAQLGGFGLLSQLHKLRSGL
ncbi:hypothetical protein CDD81_6516 [Ophiocordyceps australis]|uniref:Uncharacterized protein n=1 Tax=Ophiocordyceps australis TaxID=1399860 RepID=A0A2C5XBZ5_9HYPO|nr:hypothetical protein CDD81_6516 [Ophiocordyceps australis]